MERNVKTKRSITILAFVALVCIALSCISFFYHYDMDFVEDYSSFGHRYEYELKFDSPTVTDLLFLLLRIAPCALFLLYIFMFNGQHRGTMVYAIACGTIAVTPLLSVLLSLVSKERLLWIDWIDVVIKLSFIISFALLIINVIRGLNKKIYAVIATSIGLATQFINLMAFFGSIKYYLEDQLYLNLFTGFMSIIGTSALYVTLLLIGLNNRMPEIVSLSPEKERERVEKMKPDQALRHLKEQLELGMITEEEYQEQRADIIGKL